jgi:hypothetical protein
MFSKEATTSNNSAPIATKSSLHTHTHIYNKELEPVIKKHYLIAYIARIALLAN